MSNKYHKVVIEKVNASLYFVEGEPFAPLHCHNCKSNRVKTYENMVTGCLECICINCQTRMPSKHRAWDWNVL